MAKHRVETKSSSHNTIKVSARLKNIGDALKKNDGRASVRKIDNGFIISESFTDGKGKFHDKEVFSPTNPFADADKKS